MNRSVADLLTPVAPDRDQTLAALLDEHRPALRRIIEPKIPRRHQSILSEEDVTQQTYVDAFRNIHRFQPSENDSFKRWLFTIGMNNLRNAIAMLDAEKRGGDRQRIPLDAHDDADWSQDQDCD